MAVDRTAGLDEAPPQFTNRHARSILPCSRRWHGPGPGSTSWRRARCVRSPRWHARRASRGVTSSGSHAWPSLTCHRRGDLPGRAAQRAQRRGPARTRRPAAGLASAIPRPRHRIGPQAGPESLWLIRAQQLFPPQWAMIGRNPDFYREANRICFAQRGFGPKQQMRTPSRLLRSASGATSRAVRLCASRRRTRN